MTKKIEIGAEVSGGFQFVKVSNEQAFPAWAEMSKVVDYFHDTMIPYEDKKEDIQAALDYIFSGDAGRGGFLMLVEKDQKLVGALLMQRTGMSGYIPENILLFVTISPELRGLGVGRKLIEHCISECDGDVKLHVEYDNPAKRLYERIGFENKYADMRFSK